jgi:chemotaxis response regulator CheB
MLHALSHVHAPLLHLLHMPHEIPAKFMLAAHHACPLHVDLVKVDERVSNGAWMINSN